MTGTIRAKETLSLTQAYSFFFVSFFFRLRGEWSGNTVAAVPLRSGDLVTICLDLDVGTIKFSRNGQPLGTPITGVTGPTPAPLLS